jgi:hypothetical protein
VWNYEGVCVAVLYGHKGKNGIRSVAVNSQQTVIVRNLSLCTMLL